MICPLQQVQKKSLYLCYGTSPSLKKKKTYGTFSDGLCLSSRHEARDCWLGQTRHTTRSLRFYHVPRTYDGQKIRLLKNKFRYSAKIFSRCPMITLKKTNFYSRREPWGITFVFMCFIWLVVIVVKHENFMSWGFIRCCNSTGFKMLGVGDPGTNPLRVKSLPSSYFLYVRHFAWRGEWLWDHYTLSVIIYGETPSVHKYLWSHKK